MKRLTFLDLAILAAVASIFAPTAKAHGSSHPQVGDQTPSGVVPWSFAQRAMTWGSTRHWQTVDGTILICPWDAQAGYSDMVCKDKKNDKIDRWIPLSSYAVPGFEIVGTQYSYAGSGGSQQLTVYYGAVKPKTPVIAGVVNDADAEAVRRFAPTIQLTGPITIKADRVIVQRKKP
jgi:hypothetical protein